MNSSTPVRLTRTRLRAALRAAGPLLLALGAFLAPASAAAQDPDLQVTWTHNSATFTLANHSEAWELKQVTPTSSYCRKQSASQRSVTLSLSPSTSYWFNAQRWTAGDCGVGGLIDEVGFTTLAPPTAPPKPTGLTATAGNAQVTLSWTSGGDGGAAITRWEYGRFTTSVGQWTAVPNSGPSTTSHTVTGLTNGEEYQFKVRAVNSVGNGAESDASTGVSPEAEKPPAPSKPTATAGNAQVSLSWTSGGNGGSAITGWKYQQKEGSGDFGDWTSIPNSGASTTSYTVTNLTNGTSYQFKVLAVNAKGDGAASDASDAATPGTVPAAPTGLTATAGNGQVSLSWTAGDDGGFDVTGWKYQQKEGSGNFGDWTSIPNSGASTRGYSVSRLKNGTSYQFKVRAVNAKGDGAESAAVSATPQGVVPLAATKPSATASRQAANTGYVDLSWTSGGDGGSTITRWDYRQSEDGGNFGSWTEVPNSGASTTSHRVTNLTNGTAYRFKVRAVNARGDGAESPASDPATPAGYAQSPPATPTVTAGAADGVLIVSWDVDDGGAGLKRLILRWKPCANFSCYAKQVDVSGKTGSRTLTGLKHGTKYWVQIQVTTNIASAGWSNAGTATTAGDAADNPPDDNNDGNDGGGTPPADDGQGDGQGGGGVPPGGDGQGGGDGGGQGGGQGGDDDDDDDGDGGGVVPDPPSDPPPRWIGDLALEVAGDGTFILYWKGEWKDGGGTMAIESRSRHHGWQDLMTGMGTGSGKMRLEGMDKEEAYTLRLRRETTAGVRHSDEIAAVPDGWRGRCRGGARYMCLRDRRFEVRVHWSNPDVPGDMGNGGAIVTPISDESGLFWFFDPANIELVVKVLDGRKLNGAHWVFFGALSDVEYWLTVRDTSTGLARTYHNPPKEVCGQSDVQAFVEDEPPAASGSSSTAAGSTTAGPLTAGPPEFGGIDLLGLNLAPLPLGAPASSPAPSATPRSGEPEPRAASAASHPAGTCVPSAARLCLLDGRFALEVRFIDPNVTDPEASPEKPGLVLPSLTTEQTGFFWFFDEANIELAAKVLDGRALNGKHWLLYGGLSDVEYTLTVTDTVTGLTKPYTNEQGSVCGRIDTNAF